MDQFTVSKWASLLYQNQHSFNGREKAIVPTHWLFCAALERKNNFYGMLLTVHEATARLGITRAARYAAMADGLLKYVEKYGKCLIDERALKSYQPRAYRGQRVREKATVSG